ncbi:MAG: hypothetical protein M3Z19_02590 [Chloroflexota bacterium]|nr:hypothetical protein [Chloroflexota bacterium]
MTAINHGMPRIDPIEALRCRDDILQSMYWMRGEGFAEDADVQTLTTFMAEDAAMLAEQLTILVADGYLEETDGRYRLSDSGSKEGGRRFADEMTDLQKVAHGECGPDCPVCAGLSRDSCPHCAAA